MAGPLQREPIYRKAPTLRRYRRPMDAQVSRVLVNAATRKWSGRVPSEPSPGPRETAARETDDGRFKRRWTPVFVLAEPAKKG